MGIVYLIYCLSGFVSLGYQVAWFRVFVDRFGSTNLTFALVLCNFIGGLGAGALLSRRLTSALGRSLRLENPLRVYGILEVLIAATVLLTAVTRWIPADAWGSFPYELRDGIYRQTSLYQLSKVAIATACVFLPCLLMGATFPLLCSAFHGSDRFPSSLYAWNTLGACLGVLACEFLLIPSAGHYGTLWSMVAINFLLGLVFLLLPEGSIRRRDAEAASSVRLRPGGASPAVYSVPAAVVCAALAGLLAGAFEGDVFKRLWFLGGNSGSVMSFISFWAVLAIFSGSATVRWISGLDLRHIKLGFGVAFLAFLLVWRLAYPLMDWCNASYLKAAKAAAEASGPTLLAFDFQSGLLALLVYVGLFVFPALYFVATLLPYVCNRLHGQRRHLGIAYGVNTIAFCVGVVAFTWLAPRVNIFYSLKLFMSLFAITAVFLFLLNESGRAALWKLAGAALALLTACLLTPADFDPGFFRPTDAPARFPVSALKSNGAHTTYVVDHPEGRRLYFDNYSMSSTAEPAQRYMRLMAHFPLLLHPRPRSALLVCFGVGNTASAIAAHDQIERIDALELNDKVFETAPEFASTNHRVHEDSRLTLIHDDGRNFLNLTSRSYDLITSEPPPPMEEGVYRLYSREYYESAASHLTEYGMMTQWLPVHQLPRRATRLAIQTFLGAFPHALLFVGNRHQLILLGSKAAIDLRNIEEHFRRSEKVGEDLERLHLSRPLFLVARILKGDAALRREFAGREVVSDLHNDLAHLFLDPLNPSVVSYDPTDLLDFARAAKLRCFPKLRRALLHLGHLHMVVPDYPPSTLMAVSPGAAGSVALAGADWWRIDRLEHRAELAMSAGRASDAISFLQDALELAEELPHALLSLTYAQTVAGRYEDAVETGRRFQELEPEDPRGYHFTGAALSYLKRYSEALGDLKRAVHLDPNDSEIQAALADVHATTGRLSEALDGYNRALEIDPRNESVRRKREILEGLMSERRQE